MGVKASGGIHTAEEAQAMIDAGASRLGTSATLAIIGKIVIRSGRMNTILIGIAGGTGSGKTTLADKLIDSFWR